MAGRAYNQHARVLNAESARCPILLYIRGGFFVVHDGLGVVAPYEGLQVAQPPMFDYILTNFLNIICNFPHNFPGTIHALPYYHHRYWGSYRIILLIYLDSKE